MKIKVHEKIKHGKGYEALHMKKKGLWKTNNQGKVMYKKKWVCDKLCEDWTSSRVWKRIIKGRGKWQRIYDKEGSWLHNKEEQKITSLSKGIRFERIEQPRRIKVC